MTPQEFKAWFEGFSEGIEDVPTEKQWARVKERIAEIRVYPEKLYRDATQYHPPQFAPLSDAAEVMPRGSSLGGVK
jgi:hypothetical protein